MGGGGGFRNTPLLRKFKLFAHGEIFTENMPRTPPPHPPRPEFFFLDLCMLMPVLKIHVDLSVKKKTPRNIEKKNIRILFIINHS